MRKNLGWLSIIVFVMISIAYLSFLYDEHEKKNQSEKCSYCKHHLHR